MAGSFIGGGTGEKGVRNFVIEKRGEGEKLGPKSEGGARRKGPSAAEAAEAKVSNSLRIFIIYSAMYLFSFSNHILEKPDNVYNIHREINIFITRFFRICG